MGPSKIPSKVFSKLPKTHHNGRSLEPIFYLVESPDPCLLLSCILLITLVPGYPRTVPWFRHFLCWYFHLSWYVLRHVRFIETHFVGRRCRCSVILLVGLGSHHWSWFNVLPH